MAVIQTRGEGGHDPKEDAHACVDLLRTKKMDYESIFERGEWCGCGGEVEERSCGSWVAL